MADVIAIANQKGGVGKTTTAINLGAWLALRGQRVLLIDIDPQANATSGLGVTAERGSIYDAMSGQAPLAALIVGSSEPGLDVVPSSQDLSGAEIELVEAEGREYYLRRLIEPILTDWDFILFDCPPSLGLLTVNALTAAGQVIIPVQCEYLALEGLGHLAGTLERVRRGLNPALRLKGLVMTMFDPRTTLAHQVVAEVRRHFPQAFQTVIPRSVRLSEAPSHGLSIAAYAPASSGATAYADLADELLARRVTS
ncbi:MAG TPA: AAA family ATPase [Dehalococcoidia bacterium]|jgi:chromosome partitioning protein